MAFTFGLALLAVAYTIAHASGCHINPAVTLSFLLSGKLTLAKTSYSVNPARSVGAAVFAGSDALGQLWGFIVWPLVGAAVDLGIWRAVHDEPLEQTLLSQRRRS